MLRTRAFMGFTLPCALLLPVVALPSCDEGPPAGPLVAAAPRWTPKRSSEAADLAARLGAPAVADGVVVRLAFGPEADLDLYVTGPFEETVYYANTPSQIGGELAEDRRCEHPGTRIETIRFPATPGRYRVGVDYPHACGEARSPTPFALRVDTPTGHEEHRAIAVHQEFEPIVLEFEVETRNVPED